MYISYKDLETEQKKDLDYKIGTAVDAIAKAFAESRHNAALAFSGGKDSTVLWHLIRTRFPVQTAAAIGDQILATLLPNMMGDWHWDLDDNSVWVRGYRDIDRIEALS